MLVLSRKPGERVLLGDGIELTVVEVKGNRVRLGITAPDVVPVRRQEVDQRIDRGRVGRVVVDLAEGWPS